MDDLNPLPNEPKRQPGAHIVYPQYEAFLEQLRRDEAEAALHCRAMQRMDGGRGIYVAKMADAWLRYDNARLRREKHEAER